MPIGLGNWWANRLNQKRLENVGGQGNFGVSPTGTFETATGRRVAPIPLPGQQPAVTPSSNAFSKFVQFLKPQKQVSADANAQPQQPDDFSAYWKKPVIGKMPRDQFVQLMGTVAQSLAPNEWSGRLGGALAQQAGAAYGERMKREYEASDNALERRLREAQIQKLEQPEDALERRLKEAQIRKYEQPEDTSGRSLREAQIRKLDRPEVVEPEFSKVGALKEIAEIRRKIAEVTESNTPLTERQASEVSKLGRPVSKGDLLDEKTRLEYIDALQKQLDALLPYTRTSQENIAYDTPLSKEEKTNIYRKTYGLVKAGGEENIDSEIQKQLSPDYVSPADAKMTPAENFAIQNELLNKFNARNPTLSTPSKKLTTDVAEQYLKQFNRNRAQAEAQAKKDGYSW